MPILFASRTISSVSDISRYCQVAARHRRLAENPVTNTGGGAAAAARQALDSEHSPGVGHGNRAGLRLPVSMSDGHGVRRRAELQSNLNLDSHSTSFLARRSFAASGF